jgi:hypothetical protein
MVCMYKNNYVENEHTYTHMYTYVHVAKNMNARRWRLSPSPFATAHNNALWV